jgi:hypothetical protein
MSIGSPIPSSNIRLVGDIGLEYNTGYTDLNSYKSWRVWKKYVGYSSANTLPTSNIHMNTFAGGTRAPYTTIAQTASYTINSNTIIGQPSGWNVGHVLNGFCDYGFESGGGGVYFGSIPYSDSTFVSPFDSSANGYFTLRQAIYNYNNGQFMIRLDNPYTNPPTNAIYGAFGFVGNTGSTQYQISNGPASNGYYETVGSDYTTVWVFNSPYGNPADSTGYMRLMYVPSLSLN